MFDGVWARGVIPHTGDPKASMSEITRVLKPGGRATITHFYRRPSWMQLLSHLGRENVQYREADPPVHDYMSEQEVLDLFDGFEIERTWRDHYRVLPTPRSGLKAMLYSYGFRPVYNLVPVGIAQRFACKISVTATKR